MASSMKRLLAVLTVTVLGFASAQRARATRPTGRLLCVVAAALFGWGVGVACGATAITGARRSEAAQTDVAASADSTVDASQGLYGDM